MSTKYSTFPMPNIDFDNPMTISLPDNSKNISIIKPRLDLYTMADKNYILPPYVSDSNIIQNQQANVQRTPQGNIQNPQQTNLGQSKLSQTNLGQSKLSQTNLGQSNLTQTNLGQSNLTQTNLTQPNLAQTNLTQSNLAQTNLGQSNLSQQSNLQRQPNLSQQTNLPQQYNISQLYNLSQQSNLSQNLSQNLPQQYNLSQISNLSQNLSQQTQQTTTQPSQQTRQTIIPSQYNLSQQTTTQQPSQQTRQTIIPSQYNSSQQTRQTIIPSQYNSSQQTSNQSSTPPKSLELTRPSQPAQLVRPSQSPQLVRPSQSPQLVRPSQSPQLVRPSQSPQLVRPSQSPQLVRHSQSPSTQSQSPQTYQNIQLQRPPTQQSTYQYSVNTPTQSSQSSQRPSFQPSYVSSGLNQQSNLPSIQPNNLPPFQGQSYQQSQQTNIQSNQQQNVLQSGQQSSLQSYQQSQQTNIQSNQQQNVLQSGQQSSLQSNQQNVLQSNQQSGQQQSSLQQSGQQQSSLQQSGQQQSGQQQSNIQQSNDLIAQQQLNRDINLSQIDELSKMMENANISQYGKMPLIYKKYERESNLPNLEMLNLDSKKKLDTINLNYEQQFKGSDGYKRLPYNPIIPEPLSNIVVNNFPDLPIIKDANNIYQILLNKKILAVDSPTGTGKTAYLPWFFANSGSIVRVAIPTVVSVMSTYNFVKDKSNFSVGYAAGSDIQYSNDTRLIFGTTGHYVQKLLMLINNNKLDEAKKLFGNIFVIDEVHTATLDITLLMGIYNYLFSNINDSVKPHILLTTATLNYVYISPYFDNIEVYKVETINYPVDVKYLSVDYDIMRNSPDKFYGEIINAEGNQPGNIIIFRPGVQEVLSTVKYLETMFPRLPVYSIYSNMTQDEQNRVLENPDTQKVIVGTNIIESSITIPNVRIVIDDLLEKTLQVSKSGNNKLALIYISKSSADQRKGRTGRTMPGRCYRLCTRDFFEKLPEYNSIEIDRVSIDKQILQLLNSGLEPQSLLKIDDIKYQTTINNLMRNNLISLESGKIETTDLGIFVSKLTLSVRSSILLSKIYIEFLTNPSDEFLQFLLLSGLAVCCMIDNFTDGYFNIPKKLESQTESDYNDYVDDIRFKYHEKLRGRTDIHTFVNIYWDIIRKMTSSKNYNIVFAEPTSQYLIEYSTTNYMNYKKLKEVFNCIQINERIVISGMPDSYKINLHERYATEDIQLNMAEIIVEYFVKVYEDNKILLYQSKQSQTSQQMQTTKPIYRMTDGNTVMLSKYNFNNIDGISFYAGNIMEILTGRGVVNMASVLAN